jgi:hypothetical protein
MELRKLLGAILTAGLLYVIARWFHEYDWGEAFTKLICFSIWFALVWRASRQSPSQLRHPATQKIETALLLAGLAFILVRYAPEYSKQLNIPPKVDIGYTTERAATMLFRAHQDPYGSQTLNVRPELLPRFRGFHYGPFMLFGYAAGVISPGLGYKLSSLLFLLGTLAGLGAVLWSARVGGRWARVNALLAFVLFALLAERGWYELFRQGANDIFPVFLLAMAVACLRAERRGLAGLLVGLSFSAKFSPAIFFLVALVRKATGRALFAGFLIGCLPVALFLIWDARGALDNIFVVRFLLKYDSTSLYSITPRPLHILFPICQISAVVVTIWRNIRKDLNIDSVISSFVLLLIVQEVCFKEMHANHLLWFFPFVAYLVASRRHTVLPLPALAQDALG